MDVRLCCVCVYDYVYGGACLRVCVCVNVTHDSKH